MYTWFDYMKKQGHYITSYVIMPNHLHALIAFRSTEGVSINKIVGNGKRFMAYALVSKLEDQNKKNVLAELSSYVNETERQRNKLHEVFEPSFEWKDCRTQKFIKQKLDYIHANPCRGKWNLVDRYWDYIHSSAYYYVTGEQRGYEVFDYARLQDIDLTKAR